MQLFWGRYAVRVTVTAYFGEPFLSDISSLGLSRTNVEPLLKLVRPHTYECVLVHKVVLVHSMRERANATLSVGDRAAPIYAIYDRARERK